MIIDELTRLKRKEVVKQLRALPEGHMKFVPGLRVWDLTNQPAGDRGCWINKGFVRRPGVLR